MPNELIIARRYVADGHAEYYVNLCKEQSMVGLYIGDLSWAIRHTRIALYIRRLQRVSV